MKQPISFGWCMALALVLSGTGAALDAQTHRDDYDDVDPWAGVTPRETGPDSAAVAGFLKALATSDPVLCQFVVNNLGNNWSSRDGDYKAGNLKAEETTKRRVRH